MERIPIVATLSRQSQPPKQAPFSFPHTRGPMRWRSAVQMLLIITSLSPARNSGFWTGLFPHFGQLFPSGTGWGVIRGLYEPGSGVPDRGPGAGRYHPVGQGVGKRGGRGAVPEGVWGMRCVLHSIKNVYIEYTKLMRMIKP